MKKLNMQDERVASQRRKINSEAYGILMVVLLAAILVQQFFLNAPFEQYAAEFICFFGISFYMIARYMTLGLDIFDNEKRVKFIPLLNSIVTGIVVAAINGVINYAKYNEHYQGTNSGYFMAVLAITFISATIFTFAVLSCMNYLNKRRQAQIQKRLDENEQDDYF